jgi:hypothetical protein
MRQLTLKHMLHHSIRLVLTVIEPGRPASQARLERTICKITPNISAEKRQIVDLGIKLMVLPQFAVIDRVVRFGDSSPRWYLGGRVIESYECR